MDCKHPNIKSGYEAPYELAWCTHCGYITWCGDGLLPKGAEKSTDYTDWVRAHVRAWSCNAEAAGRGLCERWCGHHGCPAVLVGTPQVPDLAAQPVAWISTVQVGGGPEDPPEFNTVCVVGDQKPDDRNKWAPLYTAPPDLAERVERLEGLLREAVGCLQLSPDLTMAPRIRAALAKGERT